MKNVFGINNEYLENDSENSQFDGESFIVTKVDQQIDEELDSINEDFEEDEKRASLPGWLNTIKFVASVGALIIAGGIAKSDATISEAFANAPYLFIICGVLAIVAVSLWITESVKRKRVKDSSEFKNHCSVAEQAAERAKANLGVPNDAIFIDVLAFTYKEKRGRIVNAAACDFVPLEMFAYCDSDNFYLADVSSVFAFPRSEIIGIELVDKKASLGDWNKSEGPKSKKYKQYKMTVDNMDFVRIKNYYSLKLRRSGEDYEILIPAYDVESVAFMLRLQIFNG